LPVAHEIGDLADAQLLAAQQILRNGHPLRVVVSTPAGGLGNATARAELQRPSWQRRRERLKPRR
jgi:hypothetical protein